MEKQGKVQVTLRGSERSLSQAISRLCRHFTILDISNIFPGRFGGEYVCLLTVGVQSIKVSGEEPRDAN